VEFTTIPTVGAVTDRAYNQPIAISAPGPVSARDRMKAPASATAVRLARATGGYVKRWSKPRTARRVVKRYLSRRPIPEV